MHTIITGNSKNQPKPDVRLLRLVLYKGEVYRLPQSCTGIQVLSGSAWVTVAGTDIMLRQGEKVALKPGKNATLVSTLRDTPLVFETWGGLDAYADGVQLIPDRPCLSGAA